MTGSYKALFFPVTVHKAGKPKRTPHSRTVGKSKYPTECNLLWSLESRLPKMKHVSLSKAKSLQRLRDSSVMANTLPHIIPMFLRESDINRTLQKSCVICYGFLKEAWQERNMSPWAKRRVSTTAKRLFGRGEHAPSERHKSDFEKAVCNLSVFIDTSLVTW